VSPFKFVGASPGFQYLVEEESVLELNFELENTELNEFTIDLQVTESANRFTVANYLISFSVAEIFDKFICPDPSS